jgi:predicted metal-dependent peptidase
MSWNVHAILDDVSRATSSLLMRESFYGHFFVGILKEVHERVQTMAIGPSGHHVKLHINPIFWTTQLVNEKLKMGLVKHEILHVVFKHIFRGKDFHHRDLFNIACDLVVNQYIATNWLPENRIHLGLFPGIGMEPDRDADEYYRKLLALKNRMEEKEKAAGEGNTAMESKDLAGKDAWENLKRILGEDDEWQARHGLWVELDQLPAALREILEDQINQAIQESLEKSRRDTKEWGKLPAGLRQHLEGWEAARKPVVDWRRLLRLFTESSSRTRVRNTLRRPSKRYGTTPGIRIQKRQKLLVAVDTSGSISNSELEEFFAEIYHIWKQGAEVKIVECDMVIAATYDYTGKAPIEVHGRGGTSFDPPVKFANETYHPDAIIYFTDGFAPPMKIKPRMPMLWLLSTKGAAPESDYYARMSGMKVRMK